MASPLFKLLSYVVPFETFLWLSWFKPSQQQGLHSCSLNSPPPSPEGWGEDREKEEKGKKNHLVG